jgi:hypothetical protein
VAATLSLLVLGQSREDLADFLKRSPTVAGECDELRLLANPNAQFGAYSSIANHLLGTGRGDIVGMVHADTVFGPGDIPKLTETASERKICGLVGRALRDDVGVSNGYVWGTKISRETAVSTLDACSIFMPRLVGTGILFDFIRFDGWHCMVEDFCVAATLKKFPIVVPPLRGAAHLEKQTRDPEWQAAYTFYKGRLESKWADVKFRTT